MIRIETPVCSPSMDKRAGRHRQTPPPHSRGSRARAGPRSSPSSSRSEREGKTLMRYLQNTTESPFESAHCDSILFCPSQDPSSHSCCNMLKKLCSALIHSSPTVWSCSLGFNVNLVDESFRCDSRTCRCAWDRGFTSRLDDFFLDRMYIEFE